MGRLCLWKKASSGYWLLAVGYLVGDEATKDLGESELDGVGVFERQVEKSEGRAFGLVTGGALIVEVTEGEGAEGGGSAWGAVDFDVLAAGQISRAIEKGCWRWLRTLFATYLFKFSLYLYYINLGYPVPTGFVSLFSLSYEGVTRGMMDWGA